MKNKLILTGIFLWLFYFVSYPHDAFSASCSGILLWFEQILPALLPYSILSNIILSSQIFSDISAGTQYNVINNNSHAKKSAGHLPLNLAELFVIICGMTFGFPIGSKLAADLCERGIITQERAQLIAAFANNMSPAFVSNYVLTYSLNRTDLQLLTYALIYGIPLIYGVAGLCMNSAKTYTHTPREGSPQQSKSPGNNKLSQQNSFSRKNKSLQQKPASRFHIDMQIIDAGITQSFETLIRLCGYIVIFSILSHIIMQFPLKSQSVSVCLTGILEVTNGIGSLATSGLPEYVQYLLAIGFLSFGGISGIAQTGSMITHAGLSLRKYCMTKLLLTIIILAAAVIYTQLTGTVFY